jgi:sugar phosphate isomerase/epimerase
MKFIAFTKHFEGKDVAGLIEALQFIGVEGADLCVRPGYPVHPENAPTALPAAARAFAEAGLSIPMITTPGDFTRADLDYAEPLFAACQAAGIGLIKLGYWHWQPGGDGYWATVDRVRKDLEGFAALAAKYGVKACIHNHSGHSMGLNSCAAMNLVKGFDPAYIGIFADPGHLSQVGEPIDMALDIVREYLAIVAFKDILRERVVVNHQRTWQMRVVPLGEGFVDWRTLLKTLRAMSYNGPISMHCEYSGVPVETVIDQARIDLRFIRGLLAQLE